MKDSPTHYEILNVAQNASTEDIRAAYKPLARQFHPDKNRGDEAAITQFKAATEAYDILSDTDKRDAYDRSLKIPTPKKRDFSDGSTWFAGMKSYYQSNIRAAHQFIQDALHDKKSPVHIIGLNLDKTNLNQLCVEFITANASTELSEQQQEFRAALNAMNVTTGSKHPEPLVKRVDIYLDTLTRGLHHSLITEKCRSDQIKSAETAMKTILGDHLPSDFMLSVRNTPREARELSAALQEKFTAAADPLDEFVKQLKALPKDVLPSAHNLRRQKCPPVTQRASITAYITPQSKEALPALERACENSQNINREIARNHLILAGLLSGVYNLDHRGQSRDPDLTAALSSLLRECGGWTTVSPTDGTTCYPALDTTKATLPASIMQDPFFESNARIILEKCLMGLAHDQKLSSKKFHVIKSHGAFSPGDEGKIAITSKLLYERFCHLKVIDEQDFKEVNFGLAERTASQPPKGRTRYGNDSGQ